MFEPISIPFGAVMMFNVVKLKDGVSVEDVELALGEMCNVVKNTYGDDAGVLLVARFLNITVLFPSRVLLMLPK